MRQNILLIIWDSARYDHIQQNAPSLVELADNNLRYEKAISPATWSLPSHASLFTGKLPHEHGINQLGQSISDLPLVRNLQEQGYTCYGVSGNGFANVDSGFDKPFYNFWDTRATEPYPDGFQADDFATSLAADGYSKPKIFMYSVLESLRHSHRKESVINLGYTLRDFIATNFDSVQRKTHGLIDTHEYHPERNTSKIIDTIQQHERSRQPFFMFVNYMDCHRMYNPPDEIKRERGIRPISDSEINRLNEDVCHPWRFIERVENDSEPDIPDEDLELVRSLYAAEIYNLDRHLSRILDQLDRSGIRDETLIIITADHGENLGETDRMGRQRIGHEGSVSDFLLHVPLVVAHPQIASMEINERINIKNLYSLITNHREKLLETKGQRGDYLITDGPVLCEYPAVGGEEIFNRYPGVPEESLKDRISRDTAVVYDHEWKIVIESDGDQFAWRDGKPIEISEAPEDSVALAKHGISELESVGEDRNLTETEIERLEALGYI